MMSAQRVLLIRHGETEWSLSGQHTGTTDIPLTGRGRAVAKLLKPLLAEQTFALVLCSPLWRARETCDLAGLSDRVEIEHDLAEWNYGEYEGLTPQQIHAVRPGWMIFTDGCPNGEGPGEVEARIDRVIGKIHAVAGNGDVAVFSHGHLIRAFAARWLGLRVAEGRFFLLDPATVNVMSYYRGIPAVKRWNAPIILSPAASKNRLAVQNNRGQRTTSKELSTHGYR
jgi:probable phosphoglycerate mutase